jgi:hypothetical protein
MPGYRVTDYLARFPQGGTFRRGKLRLESDAGNIARCVKRDHMQNGLQ